MSDVLEDATLGLDTVESTRLRARAASEALETSRLARKHRAGSGLETLMSKRAETAIARVEDLVERSRLAAELEPRERVSEAEESPNEDLQAARLIAAHEAVKTARSASRKGAGPGLARRLELRARAAILGVEDSAERTKLTGDLEHGRDRGRDWLAKPEDPMDEQTPTETKTLETLTCDTCGKTCRGPAGLSSHKKTHAPKSPETEPSSSSRRRTPSVPESPEEKIAAAQEALESCTPSELLSLASVALSRLSKEQRKAALAWLAATCGSDERGRA